MFYQFHHIGTSTYVTVENGKNFSFPSHLHQCFEIIFLRSGKMQVTVDGQSMTLTPGNAVMIFPNQIHSLQSTQSEHTLCIFSPMLVQSYFTKVANQLPNNNLFKTDDYLMCAILNLNDESMTSEKKGVLYLLCSQFHKQTTFNFHITDKEDLLHKIFIFVEKWFAGDCTLAALAKDTGYDYSYLSRFFKKNVGMSFNTYVNHFRLSHACYLMDNGRISTLSCALDSGYTSIRSFNHNFKQVFGITPTEYRRKKATNMPLVANSL